MLTAMYSQALEVCKIVKKVNTKIKTIRVMFCPKCKSINIGKELTLTLIFGAPQQWKCNECGFKGHIFPEKDVKVSAEKNKERL